MSDESPRRPFSACMIGMLSAGFYLLWVGLSWVMLFAGWFWLAVPYLVFNLSLFEWIEDPQLGTAVMLVGMPLLVFIMSFSIARWCGRPAMKARKTAS